MQRMLRALETPIAVAVVVAAMSPGLAAAEFPVGQAVPEFSLKSPDGERVVAFSRDDRRVRVTIGSERREPGAVLMHFFQPDCFQCRAQMRAIQDVHESFRDRGVAVLGIAHRGDEAAVRQLRRDLELTYPLAMGGGSDVAQALAAGDAMAILDSAGVARFAQVGYRPPRGDRPGDEAIWRENLTRLLEGRALEKTSVDRERLHAGDLLPTIALNDVMTDKPMVLAGEEGRLTFRNAGGEVSHPKAAVGFFSRY